METERQKLVAAWMSAKEANELRDVAHRHDRSVSAELRRLVRQRLEDVREQEDES